MVEMCLIFEVFEENLYLKKYLFLFILCVYVHRVPTWCPLMSVEEIGSLGIDVPGGFEPPCGF